MTTYLVILQATLNGSASHTTRDVIDADTCADAEAQAIAAWRRANPGYAYSPLLLIQQATSPGHSDDAGGCASVF